MSAPIEAAARAIHDASGFDPDGTAWPCEACMTRAKVALTAADAAAASELEAMRAENERLADALRRIDARTYTVDEGFVAAEVMRTIARDALGAAVVSRPQEA